MKTVICIFGESEADALENMIRAFFQQLSQMDYKVVFVGPINSDMQMLQLLSQIEKLQPEYVVSWSGTYGNTTIEHRCVWENLKCPFITVIADSPAHKPSLHKQNSHFKALLYSSNEHLDFRRQITASEQYPSNGLLAPAPVFCFPRKPISRSINASPIFLKSRIDPRSIIDRWDDEKNPPETKVILFDLTSQLANSTRPATHSDIVKSVTRAVGNDWKNDETLELKLLLISEIDLMLRAIRADQVAATLLKFPVKIIGQGWENYKLNGDESGTIIHEANWLESDQHINESLFTINISPNTPMWHDRMQRAFSYNKICLSDYTAEQIKIIPELQHYTFNSDAESLEQICNELIYNQSNITDLGVSISDAFYERYPTESWVSQLSKTAQAIRHNDNLI